MVETTQTTAKADLDDSLEGQPEAETSAVKTPTMRTGRSPRTAAGRRISVVEARASALERLSSRGFRDRKSGAWAVGGPEEDTKEPERTERILATPFALWRTKPVDAFQSREGFFLFRVNGATRAGRWYRLTVIFANMGFGLLSGLQPLIMTAGSAAAVAQTLGVTDGMVEAPGGLWSSFDAVIAHTTAASSAASAAAAAAATSLVA